MAALTAHLWESSLFAVAAACLTLLFRNNGAHVRYWLWFAASLKFLIPFSLLASIGGRLGPHVMAAGPPEPVMTVVQSFSGPGAVAAAPVGSTESIDWLVLLAALWALGFVAVIARWTVQWLRIRRALRAAVPAALGTPIPVRMTASNVEPGLVGIVNPVLLLPAGMTTRLTSEELRAVLAHELSHLRRRDNLTAAIHMLAQSLFWFHPLLWWIGTRLVAERERACDEAVTGAGARPEVYAEGILKVCRLHVRSPLMCAAGVAGANLRLRIERIVGAGIVQPLGALKSAFIALAAVMMLGGPMLFGWAAAEGQGRERMPGAALMLHRSVLDAPAAPGPAMMQDRQVDPSAAANLDLASPSDSAPVGTNAAPAQPSLLAAANQVVQPRPDPSAPCPALPPSVREFGFAEMVLTVAPDGSVSNVAADPFDTSNLAEAFRTLAQKTRFLPGTVNGTPRTMKIMVRMERRAPEEGMQKARPIAGSGCIFF